MVRPASASQTRAVVGIVTADPAYVGKAEHIAQQRFDEPRRRRCGRCGAGKKLRKQRLPDAEVARDLVAQGQALGDVIIGIRLPAGFLLGDAGQHCRRDQRAFDDQGVEGQRSGVRFPEGARHGSDPGRNEDEDADDVDRQNRLDADSRHARQRRADAAMIAGELVGPSPRIGLDRFRKHGRGPLSGLRDQPITSDRGEVAAGYVLEQFERGLAGELSV
jgi:hypothetical protein